MACLTPYSKRIDGYLEKLDLPCGKCPECKTRRVNEWVFRLVQEEKVSTSAYFITLTYDNDKVPITENGFMTLSKEDFQKFMKRLRKQNDGRIRYYAAGEYGSSVMYGRPHWHCLMFNLDDRNFRYIGRDHNGYNKYINTVIEKAWSKGRIDIGVVDRDSIAYTLKYVDKEKTVPRHIRDDRMKETSYKSKGLGSNYLKNERSREFHKRDLSHNYVTLDGVHKIPMPDYYRRKLFTETERAEQRKIITDQKREREEESRKTHKEKYPNEEITYEYWSSGDKYNKFTKFKKQQIKRDGYDKKASKQQNKL